MAGLLVNNQSLVFTWIVYARLSHLMLSKCTWPSCTHRQTLDKRIQRLRCFIVRYVNTAILALKVPEFFTLVRRHLKLRQNVPCPYEGCDFETPVYSTFKAHKSRVHSECAAPFKPEVRTVASQDGDQQSENGEYGLSR